MQTSFCEDWGRTVSTAGGPGGRLYFPDAYRRDWKIGLTILLGGVGQLEPAATSKLVASAFRGPNRGRGRILASLTGTKNVTGNVFWNAHRALFPSQSSNPWAAGQVTLFGDRRTANSNTYIAMTPGTTANPAPTGTGSAPDHLVTDGAGITWKCIVAGSTLDAAVPDGDFIAGPGRVFQGVTLPEGLIPRLRRAFYIDETQIELLCYSNGAAMGDMLLRLYPGLFSSAFLLAGCGPPLDDPRYVAATTPANVCVTGCTSDITVRFGGAPPASSTAIGNHPSSQASLENMVVEMGQTGSLADTGARLDFSTVAGNEAEIWGFPTTFTDVNGNVIEERWIRVVGADHNVSVQPNGFKAITDWGDLHRRVP